MEFKHTSVLFEECMEGLNIRPDGIYVDGTLGGGGHSSGICERLGEDGLLIGIDRDRDALDAASARLEKYPCRKIFVQSNYSDIKDVLDDLGIEEIDGALLDLGVSSFQLDNPERGFSYMQDAPLDMRMSQDDDFTAYDVVNTYDAEELRNIIHKYGEERWASRIADFIVKARKDKPLETTAELVDIIKAAIPAAARRDGPHPAKRTFQAIRIEVNDELGQLERAIDEFCDVLAPGGRLCVITFHSLEDRIVKDIINKRINPCTCPKEFPVCVCGKVGDIKKKSNKPIPPSAEEVEANPRSRSAKLRVAEKK
ncbi:MAG: 16S rRNA (cytosine(1402)-N(4))-methyltransferase RsmH [Firmicutes bacterium]|nr:16S rRNA (cytosine(1402)-N(4))-methyltransferase RsmH [Bacillota bacterium]MBR1989125.1 16S rRNA (cytosine(1402)-N(4))-methyltransferase RsmH [Bacillota bacterium]MBR3706213.1 16S rRNA (cytosine(1402)-N(4))-methyltransferase RsmH [Bacillota bacterium]MBR6584340.1 16S rRNA (cytosine(1402)-N(4))-methyltransferase RsmH [Bacillota bacterium]